MKALSARHVETHGVKMPDGKEFVKDYFNDLDNKIKDEKIRIGNHELFENTICAIKNQDVKYTDKEVFKKVYLKELGLEDNEDCSLSPVDNTTQVDGDTVKMFLGKKPTDADKPNADKPADKPSIDKPDANKPSDKPNADRPNVDKPSTDKPSADNKPVDKVDTNKPVVSNTDNALDVSNANAESNRPTIANRNSNVPKTSDSSNIILYSVLLLSAITVTGIILKRRFRTE